MTHKISPISFRLGVSTSWLSLCFAHSPLSIFHSDLFLRTLIQGVFFKFDIFTSPIIIKRSLNGHLDIHLFFWDSAPSSFNFDLFGSSSIRNELNKILYNAKTRHIEKKYSKSYIITSFLFLLISKLYNIKPSLLTLHFSSIPSPVLNATILCDYLAYRISLDPYYHKPLVMEAIKASNSINA